MSENLIAYTEDRIALALDEPHRLLFAWLRNAVGEAGTVRAERLERDLDQIVMSHSNERDAWIRERDELRDELRAWRDGDLERIDILAEIVAENDRLKAELQMWQNGREATTSMAYDSTPIARLGEACDHLEAAIDACKAPLAEVVPDDGDPDFSGKTKHKRIETPVARTNGAKPKAKKRTRNADTKLAMAASAIQRPWVYSFSPENAKLMLQMSAAGAEPSRIASELMLSQGTVTEFRMSFYSAIDRAKRKFGVERDEYIEGLYQVHCARFEATKVAA